MALFGKKANNDASDVAADVAGDSNSAGGVAVAEAPDADVIDASANGKAAKAARAPKAAKAKGVRNGVAVGLNIGNQFIKAVEVTSKGGELTVTGMGAIATPPESYTNGNVLSVSALAGAIRSLFKGAGIKSKVTISSVAGTGALVVRVIEVPKMTDSELGDNMKVDADRYIPFPPSEVVMDFKALRDLPSDPDAPNMEVLLAAAQREIIDLHVQVVQKARLDPRAIDVEPLAAARAMQLERRGSDEIIDYNEVTALVNLGATGTEISILRGGILVFTRVVPGGGNAITQAISEGMGLQFSDAERVKIDSADAMAPPGYNAGGGGFGDAGDFNFGDDFGSGGDLNSAFDDISANPTAASDDPFDLDFFNQNPQEEPGAGHAQKEGEPGDTPPAFDFSAFDFDAPAPTPGAQTPDPAPSNATPPAESPTSFDFGFDDLTDPVEPILTPASATPGAANPSATTEDYAAKMEDFGSLEAPMPASVAPDSPASVGSAFDFDNFDLPATTPDMTTTALPIETAPATIPAPTPFDFSVAPAVDSPSPAAPLGPIGFDLDDQDLASRTAPAETTVADAAPLPDVAPLAFDPSASSFETEPPAPAVVAPPTASSFDFALTDPTPVPVAETPSTTSTAPLAMADEPAISAVETTPSAAPAEFDLDAIFGTPAESSPTSNAAATAPTVSLDKTEPLDDFGIGAVGAGAMAAGMAAPRSDDDFDLSGIDTGTGDDFGAGFGGGEDFTEFGAGLGGGANADAAALYGLISPALEELASEVRRSLEFHLGRYPDATISRLVLLGGGARLRNLDVFLTQMIGVPTAVGNPFTHLAVQTPKMPPDYATQNGPLCAVALGLALRDFLD